MLAAERKVTSKLLEQDTSAEKLYILNEYVTPALIDEWGCRKGKSGGILKRFQRDPKGILADRWL